MSLGLGGAWREGAGYISEAHVKFGVYDRARYDCQGKVYLSRYWIVRTSSCDFSKNSGCCHCERGNFLYEKEIAEPLPMSCNPECNEGAARNPFG